MEGLFAWAPAGARAAFIHDSEIKKDTDKGKADTKTEGEKKPVFSLEEELKKRNLEDNPVATQALKEELDAKIENIKNVVASRFHEELKNSTKCLMQNLRRLFQMPISTILLPILLLSILWKT